MPKMVVLITPLVDRSHEIGDQWKQAGAPGVTFIESYGLYRLQEASRGAEVLPGFMSMIEILRSRDENGVIIFSVVPDDALVDRLIAAAEVVLGPISNPTNGILFVLDVERTLGIRQG
jgi:hypothetical protein